MSATSGNNFGRGRLGDVVVGPGGEGFQLLTRKFVVRESNQRQFARGWLGAQNFAKRKAIDSGQGEVHHDNVATFFLS
jgi:hypothetical protein